MKLLLATENLDLGGAQVVTVSLANALVERGIEVIVAARPGPLRQRLLTHCRFAAIPAFSPMSAARIVVSLASLLRHERPDIIHSQSATIAALARAAIRITGHGVPIVLTHHSCDFQRWTGRSTGLLLKRTCDRYVALTEEKRQQGSRLGVSPDRISVVPNFVDVAALAASKSRVNVSERKAALGIRQDSLVVATAGRLIPSKRFDVFLRVVSECSSRLSMPLVGLLLGDGPCRSALEAEARAAMGRARFLFPGYQPDIVGYLAIADAFLFPSEHEVLSLAVMESLAVGVPVVCSKAAGSGLIVHRQNGFVASCREEDYVRLLLRVLLDRNCSAALATSGLLKIRKEFDKPVVLDQLLSMYGKLLNDGSQTPASLTQPEKIPGTASPPNVSA